jgi:alkanesulfonate monooxygenase SsuD/methylene tetrahydromethanopterin reductase-like flavin-dependent oxidoreductase (luciferase family)
MPDYGHDLLFGSFITPTNGEPETVLALATLSEEVGLDLVTFQDHPYQPRFLDTWTLMSYVAAATSTIHIAPNVLNLPLRPPAVTARAAASLDILSGGRFDLGLGSGAFWNAIEAMGGRRLRPGQAVEALEEAIAIMRAVWDGGGRDGVRVDGTHYRVMGAKRGPTPTHEIPIWVGAYRPRMLRLTGRVADGWLPSMPYLEQMSQDGRERIADSNRIIDEAAEDAGRPPRAIRRLLNLAGSLDAVRRGRFDGPASQWVEELTVLALEDGVSGFILPGDDAQMLRSLAEEVVPAVRDAVERARDGPP